MSSPSHASTRRVDLDWVRIIAFGLLIFYHIGMYYVTWDFHIKSPHASRAIEPIMRITSPWRLGLLFLVSGVATRYMLDKWSARQLVHARSWRLLVPLTFGMLIIIPPQTYYEVVEKLHYSGGFFGFYQHYLSFDGKSFCPKSGCIIMPTWNHLWFVPYLWVYTMIAAALWTWWPRLLRDKASSAANARHVYAALLIPFVLLALSRMFLFPRFGSTHNLAWDWYNHGQYLLLFGVGLVYAQADNFWQGIKQLRWLCLLLAITAYFAIEWYISQRQSQAQLPTPITAAMPVIYGLYQWAAMLGILGFAQIWLSHKDNAARRYLTEAIFPYYIVHQTVIIVAAHHLQPLDLPLIHEALIIVAITALSCVLTYEIVRRIRWLRPLFGVPTEKRTAAS